MRQLTRSLSCFALCLGSGLALAQTSGAIDLYMDAKTRQLFAEPGDGRIKLGSFRPVDAAAEATAASRLADAATSSSAPSAVTAAAAAPAAAKPSGSRPSVQVRGYVQARYSDIISGDEGVDLWTDRSVGDADSINGDSFIIRRGRLVFSSDVNDHLSVYIQPDFASTSGTTGNVLQLRDAYADVNVDTAKVHRFRVGQSKVPFGFENLQSSQNRLTLDRADALNSGVRDERDTGVFYYYTPQPVQKLFQEIQQAGLKHSGNYGMIGYGVYNGQGANRRDTNDTLHQVARVSIPFKATGGQFYELGVQGYRGKFVPSTGEFTGLNGDEKQMVVNAKTDARFRKGFDDERVGVSAILYPQPFGLQAEWNWGTSPGLDLATRTIDERDIEGGYIQAMYQFKRGKEQVLMPFVKWQSFDGYNKAETNAPRNRVNDWEFGLEWQFNRQLELTAVYHQMDRNNLVTGNRADKPDYAAFDSDALRLQLQYSF